MSIIPSARIGALCVREILQAFSFLEEIGYTKTIVSEPYEGFSTDYTEVRFESPAAFFDVFIDHLEEEIAISMGLVNMLSELKYEIQIKLYEAFLLSGKEPMRPVSLFRPRSEDALLRYQIALREKLDTLAAAICESLLDALANATTVYPMWEKLRREKGVYNTVFGYWQLHE